MTSLTPSERKEFEELKKQCAHHYDLALPPEVLSFIDTLLHKREQAWRKRVEGAKEKIFDRSDESFPTPWVKVKEVNQVLNSLLSENITDK